MKVIDTHSHIGFSRYSGLKITGNDLIKNMEDNSIYASLVMPQPSNNIIKSIHSSIYKMSLDFKNKIFGIFCVNPWVEESIFLKELLKCITKYNFVGIKINTFGHNISPLAKECEKIYNFAKNYNIPVLIHTGLGTPNSLPSLVLDPAKRYPDVTFIMSHAGFAIYTDEAMIIAKYCDNIVLEPSWCQTGKVKRMINTIGIDRIIMGSDHLTNLPVELTKYKSICLNENDLEKIFYLNPKRIFNLDI